MHCPTTGQTSKKTLFYWQYLIPQAHNFTSGSLLPLLEQSGDGPSHPEHGRSGGSLWRLVQPWNSLLQTHFIRQRCSGFKKRGGPLGVCHLCHEGLHTKTSGVKVLLSLQHTRHIRLSKNGQLRLRIAPLKRADQHGPGVPHELHSKFTSQKFECTLFE